MYTPPVPAVSVVVITQDEAANIEAALRSVVWADEIVVVDSGSTDDTVARARTFTDHVVTRAWEGYGAQKNYANGLARNDWILSLDADERVSQALATEIRDRLRDEPLHRGYHVPRLAWYMGRWIRSTDWYPDYQLRLYDRRVARWSHTRVHESVRVDGPVGSLRAQLEHFAYRDLSHHLVTMDRYTTLAAQQMLDEGRRTGMTDLTLHPPLAFLRNYILRLGVRDGLTGFIVSVLNAYYVFLKFTKLRELQVRRERPTSVA